MLKHVNTRIALGIVISLAFLVGTIAAPVAAYQTNMVTEYYNDVFPASENNHTYVHVDPDTTEIVSRSWMHCNSDIDYTRFMYDQTGWDVDGDFLSDPTSYPFNWQQSTFSNGPFGDASILPAYYDFVGVGELPAVVNTTQERRTFSLAFGQHTPIVIDQEDIYYIGGLGISGVEFVHLIVDCRNDGVMWEVVVVDPEGRLIGYYGATGGDIIVFPFKPSVAGVYQVAIGATISPGNVAIFDILPQAIAPQPIALGEVVSGDLLTGEIVVNEETDSWLFQELVPTVHTYKVTCPNDIGKVSYVFNYPEAMMIGTQMPRILFTSGSFVHDVEGGVRYMEGITNPNNGEYYYCAESHYVTVMGGDGVSYSLYHEATGVSLPTNNEFILENVFGESKDYVYKLDVDTPSTIRVNTTSVSDYEFYLVGYHDDGYRYSTSLAAGANIEDESEVLLPAGEYFIIITVDAYTYGRFVEFSLGEFVDESQADISRIGGFLIDTEPYTYYNFTVRMNNPDNVTVAFVMIVYDQFGTQMLGASYTLANWFDGSSIIPHSTYDNYVRIMVSTNQWSEDFAYVSILPFAVTNNTAPGGNVYEDYPVDFEFEVDSRMNDFYKDFAVIDASAGADFHNFTLSALGDSVEYYGVYLNTTPGTWYNVSIMTNDVTGVQVVGLFIVDMRTFNVPWSDLSYTYVGAPDDLAFQFGSIGDEAFFRVRVNRPLSGSGALWIQLTPLETNQLSEIGPIRSGSNILAQLGGLAIPLAGGGIVIVVVAVLYFKKFKK